LTGRPQHWRQWCVRTTCGIRANDRVFETVRMSTPFHAKYWAESLRLAHPRNGVEGLSRSLGNARVDLNPHQVDAALFALRSPYSKGVMLTDEVGLGKTIEAALILAQKWAERRRRILLIVPATLRKQWVASIRDLPGCHTQARTLEQAQERVREALAVCTSDKLAASTKLEHHVILTRPLEHALADVVAKKELAGRVAAEAENAVREVAVALSKRMGLRDVGTLLGVSRQRAHQLVSDSSRKAVPIKEAKVGFGARPPGRPRKSTRIQKHRA
jgi:predicted RNase H-like HicB family nuclease